MSELDTTARALAECAVKQQAAGRLGSAERLLMEARSLNADEVAAVLREHEADPKRHSPHGRPTVQ